MIAIICNPTAGNGRGKKEGLKINETLRKRGRECRLLLTEYPGHATALAKKAWEDGAELVLSVGGDGTAYEVASGLLGSAVPLGIIPAGTGNDFAGIDLPDGASVIGRVFAQGINLVSEEFDADGKFHSGRKNIENAAAFGKFAGRGGLRLVVVTEGDKTFDELCHIDGVAAMQNDSGSLEFVRIWSR